MFAVELIQSILLIISAILMIISAIGFLTLDKNMNNLIYARIHIVGVFDVAFIIAMIGLQQYLLAGIYLVIAPFTAHAIANAFYNSEDKVNNLKNKEVEVESSDDENPFVHNINKVKNIKIIIKTFKEIFLMIDFNNGEYVKLRQINNKDGLN